MPSARAWTDAKLEEMEKHLNQIYKKANKEIGKTWKAYMKESGKEIAELQKKYDAAKKSGDEKEKRRLGRELSAKKKERTLYDKHYKDMTEHLAHELSRTNEIAAAYINDQLPGVYVANYNEIATEIDGVNAGVSFDLVDERTVKVLATKDETLLPYKDITKKDVRWNTKAVNSQVLQGILQGESMDEIAKRLGNVTAMDANAAIRNARTAVTGAENRGRMDMLHDARSKGVIMNKIWLATSDSRTRDAHAELDGQEQAPDDPFKSELGEIMYPGDPTADPANVYNCRCTLRYKVVGFERNGKVTKV